MAVKLISDIYDIPALQAQQEQFINLLKESKSAIIDLNNQRITTKGSALSEFSKATDDLDKAINKSVTTTQKAVKAHDTLSLSVKEHEKTLSALANAQAKGNALTSQSAIELAKQNAQNQLQAKANKEVAQSVLGLIDQYGLLKKEYNETAAAAKNLSTIALKSGNEDDISKATAATAKAKALHDSLLQIEQGVGQSQRNVGNYTGALKVLDGALLEAKTKLDQMTASERANTAAGQALTKEVGLLSTLAGQQSQGFTSLRREVMNATQALATMQEQGLAGSPAFKELQLEVASAKRGLIEFQNQQKLLSSEAPALAGMTAAAKGLAGAYAVGAGAAALFADGDEKVEKELQKLVAIMTVLQGLTEFNKFLQERTAVATALNNVQIKAGNILMALKNYVLTGNTQGTVANTVATEANAVAMVESSVATRVATGAMVGFRAALIATGIGAILVLLPLFASGMSSLHKETEKETKAQEELNQEIAGFNKSAYEEIGTLTILTQALTGENIPRHEKELALKRLQELYPEYFKNMNIDKLKTDDITKATNLATLAILNMSIAKQKQAELDRLIQQKALADAADNFTKNLKANLKLQKQKADIMRDGTSEETANRLLGIKGKEKELTLDQKILQTAKEIAELDPKLKTTGVTEDKPKKDKKDGSLQELKTVLDNDFAIYKIHQEAKIRIFEAEIKSEKTYYLDKLAALDNYVKAQKQLLDREEANEIAKAKAESAREIQHLQESKSGKSDTEKARIDENIKIQEQNLREQILLIQATYSDRSIQLVEDSGRTRQEILDRQHEAELRNYQDFKKQMEDAEKKDDDRIAEGFKRRAEMEKDFNAKMLQLDKEINERKAQVAIQGEDFLYNLATASFERQLNLIKDQKDEIDKRRDASLTANDAIVQSEQDKAANIAIINSRAQIQKDALDRKAAEIENRKAQFERAQQLFEISIATIKAIAQIKIQAAVLAANPYGGPILAAKALSQIPLVLISSALSIGALFAKPLPKYKGGRDKGIEEDAIVGDGGVSEYIHRADGTIERTPAVETITHLMPKDRVYKNKETMMKELAMSAVPLSGYVVNASGGIDKADMEKFTDRIENAIGNVEIHTQVITREGWREQTRRVNNYNRWVETVVKQ